MFTRIRLLVLVILFLAGTSGWLGYLVYAAPSGTNIVVTPSQEGSCTWFVYMEGTTPFARALVAGLSVNVGDNVAGTAGQDPAAFVSNLQTTNSAFCLAPNTTFNAVSTLTLKGAELLRGAGTSSTIWSCSGAITCIQTNANSAGPVLLDQGISDLEIDGSTTGVVAALWINCAQRFTGRNILFGSGSSSYEAILLSDSGTCGTFENSLYSISFRGSAAYNSSIVQNGVNPGPNFLYGTNLNANSAGINLRCSILDVYGDEIDQGPTFGVSTVMIKLAKSGTCNFAPELTWDGGAMESTGAETTAISLDASSRAYIVANLALSGGCSQVSLASGGILYLDSLGAGSSCVVANSPAPGLVSSNSKTAQSATISNLCSASPVGTGIYTFNAYILITAYTSGSVVAQEFWTDPHGTMHSGNIVSVGSATFGSGTITVQAGGVVTGSISVSITGTFSATYDTSCSIMQTG